MGNSKRKMKGMLYLFIALFLFFVSSFPAYAQLDPTKIRIGGEIRERYEYRDNTDFNDNASDTKSFVLSRIRVHLGVDVTSNIEAYVQIQDSRAFGSEGTTGATTATSIDNIDLHQGYINLKNISGAPLNLKIGRQEIFFGDHRLVGHFGWSNIGRAFDGARLTYKAPLGSIDIWATTVIKSTTAPPAAPVAIGNGVDPAPAGIARDAQSFYGIYASLKPAPILTIEPYLMDRRDTTTAFTENRYTLGVRADAKAGMIDATGELAYQLGDSNNNNKNTAGSNPSISAFAVALKAGVTLPAPMSPRVGIEYDMASGDDNTTDGDDKTFNNLFPTNHPHYGYMDLVGWQNMNDIRLSISAKPTPATAVSLDYHIFTLDEKNDSWYRANGAAFGKIGGGTGLVNMTGDSIGSELDLWGSITVMEKLKIDGAIAWFLPGDVAPPDDNSTWFYLQGTVPF